MSGPLRYNGAPEAPSLAWHRGLHYGDGVFRTCLIYASKCIDLKEHIEKLLQDAEALGLAPPAAEVLAAEAAALAGEQVRGVLKLILMRGGGERGYASRSSACDRLLCGYPAPDFPAAHWDRGIRAFRSDFRLAAQPALAGIKHLNRLEQVLASRAWQPGAEEAIVGDADGEPVCGTRSNLFWVAAGTLHTPALEQCGVAGVMRERVMALARQLGIPVSVGRGRWSALEAADEAFVTNSVFGLWPLASLDSRAWNAPGPVTRRLSGQLRHPRLVRP